MKDEYLSICKCLNVMARELSLLHNQDFPE